MSKTRRRHSEDVSCVACGSALHVAADTRDTAVIRCEICQSIIGTWADVKADAQKRREDN